VLTGCYRSVYDPLDYVEPTKEFIRMVYTNYQHIKLTGWCFGHQIIAEAFGGKVERMNWVIERNLPSYMGREELAMEASFSELPYVADLIKN